MNNEQKDQLLPSASLEQNGLLSSGLSVEEGNRLIAKFMGWEIESGMEREKDPYYNEPYKPGFIPRIILLSKFPFHSSWDWLMPVVEEIEMLHWNDRNNQFNPPLDFFLQNKIEFVWNHVVKFLKWYNLNAVPVGSR